MKKQPKQTDRKGRLPKGKQGAGRPYATLAGLGVILLLGILIYSNSFNCTFHFDDLPRIVNNTDIQKLSDIGSWWNTYPSRPAGMFTFALNYHFSKLDVRYYHLVNLLVHLSGAVLVWWLTLLLFSTPVLGGSPLTRHKKLFAFFTALLFVSHPLATQSVTYIVQRMASMAAVLYLLSVALYISGRLQSGKPMKSMLLFAGALLSALLAMLTKENAYALPFAWLLAELFLFRKGKFSENFRDYRLLGAASLLLLLVIAAAFAFGKGVFRSIPPSNGDTFSVTPLSYLFTQFFVIWKYIGLLILPVNQNLDPDIAISLSFFNPWTLLGFAGIVLLVSLGIYLFNRNRLISFGIFWFFLTMSVESGFIPISDLMFEHRTYLPSYGFFLVLTSVVFSFMWDRYRIQAVTLLLVLAAVYSVLTFQRNQVWKDDLSLWNDTVMKSPGKARPYTNRGNAYGDLGQWEKALADYSKAVSINPAYTEAVINHGAALASLGQWKDAIADYDRAIETDPGSAMAYADRGIALTNLGEDQRALDDFTHAISINPKYLKPYYNRGVVYGRLGQWEKAIADYSKAISIYSGYFQAYVNRSAAYGSLGRWNDAIADCSRAIEINPGYEKAWFNRGTAYCNLGQYDKGVDDFNKTLELDPGFRAATISRNLALERMRKQK